MTTRGILRGLGPSPFAPSFMGGADPANDGSVLTADSTMPGGAKLATTQTYNTGFYVPRDWGKTGGWATARAAAVGRLVPVMNWSASIWNGFYSSNWQRTTTTAPTGVEGLVMDRLQQLYGDGGSGFISVFCTTGVTAGSASTITATGSGGTGAGGWDSYLFGINSMTLLPHASGNGATLTDTNVRGTSIDIYWLPVTATGNTFTYNIDSSGAVTVDTHVASVTGLGRTTITGLSDTTHTLVISNVLGFSYLMGWTGRRATGILPIRMGHAGRTMTDVSTAAPAGLPAAQTTPYTSIPGAMLSGAVVQSQQGVNLWPQALDLMIVGDMGINDIANGTTSLLFEGDLTFLLDIARTANSNCDIVIVPAHRGNTADANEVYSSYIRPSISVAEGYGAAVINMWPLGRNAYAPWNTSNLGYWGDGTNDGLAGSDGVHLSDKGHAFVAKTVLPLLTS